MADGINLQQAQTQASVTTPTTPAAQTPAGVQQADKPLTADEVKRIARQEAVRVSQSITGKAEARLNQQLEALKAANVPVTKEQESALREQITEQVMQESDAGQAAPSIQQQTQTTPTTPALSEAAVRIALAAMEAEGVTIEDNDPELPAMTKVLAEGKPGEQLKAVQTAIAAKKARLQQAAQTAHLRTPPGGGGPTQPPAKSSEDYWRNAFQKPG